MKFLTSQKSSKSNKKEGELMSRTTNNNILPISSQREENQPKEKDKRSSRLYILSKKWGAGIRFAVVLILVRSILFFAVSRLAQLDLSLYFK